MAGNTIFLCVQLCGVLEPCSRVMDISLICLLSLVQSQSVTLNEMCESRAPFAPVAQRSDRMVLAPQVSSHVDVLRGIYKLCVRGTANLASCTCVLLHRAVEIL